MRSFAARLKRWLERQGFAGIPEADLLEIVKKIEATRRWTLLFRDCNLSGMQLTLRSNLAKRTLLLCEVLGTGALALVISKNYVAEIIARQPAVKRLQLAIRLDPRDSEYHLRLARVLEYSPADIDPNSAVGHLRRAVELNPRSPEAWLDLGGFLELRGKTSEAEACLRRADFLAPNLPVFQWGIGNFLLLHGNIDEAFRHFKVVLAASSRYDQILFDMAWKASGDGNKILEELIPNDVNTEFNYLYYLLGQKRYLESRSVWKRIAASSQPFPPAQAAGYIDTLIGAHRWVEAYDVWGNLRQKGLIKATYQATSKNLILNGDFEKDPLGMGFDWRILPVQDTFVGLDETQFHSRGHSLLIQFLGKRNLDYRNVWQYVPVAPGHSYRLQGFVKTERITTDSGPRLEVHDAYNSGILEKLSDGLTGSTAGWSSVTLDFTAPPKTELIIVGIARLPSRKFDNLIAGKVWVDDLSLIPVPADTPLTR